MFNINIDGKNYEFLNSTTIDNKSYVAFFDEDTIYIKEYTFLNDNIIFNDIDDATYEIVRKEFNI